MDNPKKIKYDNFMIVNNIPIYISLLKLGIGRLHSTISHYPMHLISIIFHIIQLLHCSESNIPSNMAQQVILGSENKSNNCFIITLWIQNAKKGWL